jgi:hypothetical protein
VNGEGSTLNNNDAIAETIESSMQYVMLSQNIDGGFSPYPDSRRTSGVLATADVLTAILRALSRDSELEDKMLNRNIAKTIMAAVTFLVNSRIEDGGFPPKGDVYVIEDVSFSDATADALLALVNVQQTIYQGSTRLAVACREVGDVDEEEISKRIADATKWLTKYLDQKLLLPSFVLAHTGPGPHDRRVFPNVLAGMAFSILKNRSFEFMEPYRKEISRCTGQLLEEFEKTINDLQYAPFRLGKSECSFVNTCFVLQLLKWETDCKKEEIVNRFDRDAESWYANWEKTKSYQDYTDLDNIDTSPISSRLPFYRASYFRLPPLLSVEVEYKHNNACIERRVSELLSLRGGERGSYYYYEHRGNAERALSATASAIIALAEVLSYRRNA